jgi:DNA-binding response OmpR family regulator/two-component sensor histidine kinase
MRTPPRILAVDDNPMNLDIIQACLSAHGYEIVTAADGEAALSLAVEQLPDLILLDVMMPKRDGIDVCRTLKEDRSLPFIPIILVTARADSQDVVHGLDAGADEYLTKPVDHASLIARVRSMLRIKEQHDTIQQQAGQLKMQAAELAARNNELTLQLIEEAKLAEIARLLGDIGHDVKNMMMPILLGVDLLDIELKELIAMLASHDEKRKRVTEELSHEVFGMVRSNSRRVQDRVKEIADAVKGCSGPPTFAPCTMGKLVAAVLDTLRFPAEQKSIRLSTMNLENLPVIQADESRLFNAIYNLVNNAIPETPAGGTVTIEGRYHVNDDTLTLLVSDTGRGMPPEVRESLFSGRVISRKVGGTGLGTKIVKDVVDSHFGSITVESEEKKGTTFLITLPLDPSIRTEEKIAATTVCSNS